MDVKFGKIRPNSDLSINISVDSTTENLFAATSDLNQNNHNNNAPKSSGSRINDYDSHILENNAYQTLPDEIFKLEHKIATIEEMLVKIDNEIKTLEGVGYDIQIYDLKSRKQKLEQELIDLNNKYSNLGFSTKLSGRLSSAMNFATKGKNNALSKASDFLAKNVLAKVSKTFGYKQGLKEALDSLSNINLSVDELIKMQVPYGETVNRYEKLTAYLNKANVIHSHISKNMNVSKNVKK